MKKDITFESLSCEDKKALCKIAKYFSRTDIEYQGYSIKNEGQRKQHGFYFNGDRSITIYLHDPTWVEE